jgi:hypothetical protein
LAARFVERRITAAFSRASNESAHTLRINPALIRRAVMRKFVLSVAAAGTALALASPAAAQNYYPQSQPYGYGNGGYGNGYNGYYGQVRALQARIDRVQWQIDRLGRYNGIRDGSSNRLRDESRNIERRLNKAARYGLSPYEARDINNRIARLEQRVQFASANRYGRYGDNRYGYTGQSGFNSGNGYYGTRDGDDDRYGNDQGRDHHDRYDNDQSDDDD